MNNKEEKEEWCDYPYIGIGEKPKSRRNRPTEEELEKIIGG